MGIKKLIRKGEQDKAASKAASKIKPGAVPIKEATRINTIRYGDKKEAIKAAGDRGQG